MKMAEHVAIVRWENQQEIFIDNQYSRKHHWAFDGGMELPASASPHVVPIPYSDPTCVDPEEVFVAALASCHMLFFLSIAAKQKFKVESYIDRAVGKMAKNDSGQLAVTTVHLNPQVVFSGDRVPTPAEITAIHDQAHHQCFLANSVKTEIMIQPG
jgi:organic hydroperoxide reductase OsmC/OhrA